MAVYHNYNISDNWNVLVTRMFHSLKFKQKPLQLKEKKALINETCNRWRMTVVYVEQHTPDCVFSFSKNNPFWSVLFHLLYMTGIPVLWYGVCYFLLISLQMLSRIDQSTRLSHSEKLTGVSQNFKRAHTPSLPLPSYLIYKKKYLISSFPEPVSSTCGILDLHL